MPTNKTTTNRTNQLEAENQVLSEKINNVYRRLGGLRYHVMTESANGNDLGPTDFVRLVDNIMEEA